MAKRSVSSAQSSAGLVTVFSRRQLGECGRRPAGQKCRRALGADRFANDRSGGVGERDRKAPEAGVWVGRPKPPICPPDSCASSVTDDGGRYLLPDLPGGGTTTSGVRGYGFDRFAKESRVRRGKQLNLKSRLRRRAPKAAAEYYPRPATGFSLIKVPDIRGEFSRQPGPNGNGHLGEF